ncbi:hypothetical protein [Oceanobacillus massiliensis]|uniref:hypothetical protein n=1 Tax=Oceanobacillus massiliensis TaxID=1465765 RepID=UPI000287B696|nr:hypothetical protein [Oceanobacillus massiliensis]
MLENNKKEETVKEHVTKQMNSIKVPKGLKEEMWTQVKSERKKSRLNSKVLPYLAAIACIAILVPLGLSGLPFDSESTSSDVATTEDKNIGTIEAVLQNALNGPSEELKKVFESDDITEDIRQYDRDHFEDYFADETSYLEFVNNYSASIMIDPMRSNYQLNVKSIEYEKTESKEIIYDFTVELEYKKDGSKSSKIEMVDGGANLNEKHKIEDIDIRIDKVLQDIFNESH